MTTGAPLLRCGGALRSSRSRSESYAGGIAFGRWVQQEQVAGRAQMDDVRVDLDGIHFAVPFTGSADVYFGDKRGWSFSAEEQTEIRWPRKLRTFLDGWSDVRVADGEDALFAGRVVFTEADREVVLVDRNGIAIIVDKWGLIQRPFEHRDAGVVGAIADEAQRILEVMRRDCGIEGWISFGTLLGAARDGGAIGHDSDIDLCYVSEQPTPAEMTVELWRITRALRAAGMRVLEKTGSFVTVEVTTPDGATTGIDIYTSFFEGGLLYETATVRAPVPREAVLPRGEIEFEGRTMPAPADPARLLEVSYGPNWRVPDPSFRHEPGPEIHERFEGWFGSLWRQRRDWRSYNTNQAEQGATASEFAAWVADRLEPGTRVVDIGAGTMADQRYFAERGFRGLGLDYAFPPPRLREVPETVHAEQLNLYDDRDVLTRGALGIRHNGPQVVYARELLETLAPDGLVNFWRLVGLLLRRGGDLYLESRTWPRGVAGPAALARGSGRLRPLSPRLVADDARRAGGEITLQEGVADGVRALTGTQPARWRMVVHWPALATVETPAVEAETTNGES